MSPPYRIDSFLAYMKTHPVKDGRQRNGIELTELEQVVHTRLAEDHSGVVGREDLPVVSHFWIFTFLLVGHNPRSCSFTSAKARIPVHTAAKSGTNLFDLRRSTFIQDLRGAASLRCKKSDRNHCFFMCEQKLCRYGFRTRRNSYPVKSKHSLQRWQINQYILFYIFI